MTVRSVLSLGCRRGVPCLLAVAAVACRQRPDSPPAAPAAEVAAAPVASMPELPTFPLDRLEPAVAEQVRGAEAAARSAPDSADAAGRLGMLYQVYGLTELARPCYERAGALDATSSRWAYYQGLILKSLGELDAGAAAFERALNLDPGNVHILVEWAELELMRGRPAEALAGFRQALTARPNYAIARCGAGRALLAMDKPREALEELTMAVNSEPDYGAARYAMGLALRKLGRQEDALRQLELAEKLRDVRVPYDDPLRRELEQAATGSIDLLHRGTALLTEGDATAALPLLEEAARQNPSLAEAQANLGTALVKSREFDRAEPHLRRALELDPNYVQARHNLGLIFHRRAQAAAAEEEREALYRLAVAEFRQAVATRDDHFESHLALGTDLAALGRDDEAVTPLRNAERLRPYDARPAKALAESLMRLGRDQEAELALRDAMARMPEDYSLRDRLAWLLATLPSPSVGQTADALALARQVHERTGGVEPVALDTLAAALASDGQYDQAVAIAGVAAERARLRGKPELAEQIDLRRLRYERGEPFRRPGSEKP